MSTRTFLLVCLFGLDVRLAVGAADVSAAVVRAEADGPSTKPYDIVLEQGEVIDPEKNIDSVLNIGIRDGKIAAVSKEALEGKLLVNARGLVVAPGFIDCHTHGQNKLADRVQAYDGVTTALELEAGTLPVAEWYDIQARSGRVLNYGASAGWAAARISILEGIPPKPTIQYFFDAFERTKWQHDIATPGQVDQIVKLTEQGLKQGGLGVGILAGYAPGHGYKELLALHALSAKYKVPTYTHVRSHGDIDPLSAVQAYGELISFAVATGSHIHICHLNSTSFRDIGMAVPILLSGRNRGLNITVEAYSYGAGSTAIGAAFLAPENLPHMGTNYGSVEYNGMRLDEKSFKSLREKDPRATIVLHYYELPRDQHLLDLAVLFPGGIIASDAMPWRSKQSGKILDGDLWPFPDDAFAHPRSAGNFANFLAQWSQARSVISLSDAIAKCSLFPAKMLEQSTPAMKKKGRLQVGMDADVIVFDRVNVNSPATFDRPNQISRGMRHVLVNGVFVIRDGALDTKAFPGRPVRRPLLAVEK